MSMFEGKEEVQARRVVPGGGGCVWRGSLAEG